jgi:hypothetical protein
MEPVDFFAYASGAFIEPGGLEPNVELIVHAVNCHADLLEACRGIAETADSLWDVADRLQRTNALRGREVRDIAQAIGRMARAAIAKAES